MKTDIPNEDGSPKLLYISERLGGWRGAKGDVEAALDELFRLRDEACPPLGSEDLRVDLVFDVPGPILPVDYEGVRTGRFSMVEHMLQIQVAVPDEITGPDMPRYLSEVLTQMLELAKAYVKRRKLPLSTEALERAISELIARLPA